MFASEESYQNIAKELKAEISKMFGKPCLKANGKAFAAFFQDEMVFKLTGQMHEKAINLKDSKLWDPSGKNKPMKEWVQIPYIYHKKWIAFAQAAMNYIRNQNK